MELYRLQQPEVAVVAGGLFNRPAGRVSLAIFALAAAGLIAFGADQAPADHVNCGDTITVDTTLDSDLVDCPDYGIVIGADNITLDLNGHLIDGDDPPNTCEDPECDVGIYNNGNNGVTVRNGSVRGFNGDAVLIVNTSRNRVAGISSVSGIEVYGTRNVIARNRHVRGFFGIFVDGGRNQIARNVVVGARDGIVLSSGGFNNILRRNRVRGSRRDGIWINEAGSVLRRNLAIGSGDDGIVARDRSTVTRNRAVRNGDLGIKAGFRAIDGGGNRAHGNGNPAQCEGVVCK
jgi:parallel beta-helix repeat protein